MGKTYNPVKKKEYYLVHKEYTLEKAKVRYQLTKEEKILYQRKLHLQKKYFPSLTLDEALLAYNKILEQQHGVCKICGKPETKVDKQRTKTCALAVDHCHKTGKVRGLLCFICNTNLGRFEAFLPKILNYIGAA